MLWQVLATVGLVAVVVFFVRNASDNMVKAGIASGFQFLWRDSGIEVPFNITGYKPSDTILALLWTGIVNTLLVSAAAVVVATVVGFTVGLMRLSHNWLLSTLAAVYVEFVRNIPLLFFVLFWYFGVLSSLPTPKESYDFLGVAFLNRRGLSIPLPNDVTGFRLALLAILVLIGAQIVLARWARARQARTGRDFPTWLVGFVLCGAPADRWPSSGRAPPRAGTCPPCAASTTAAASCWCRSSWRCSWRCRPTRRASSPKSCAAASSRCARARSTPRGRSASRPAGSCGWS